MQIGQTLNQSPGTALHHHSGSFGVCIAAIQPHSGNHPGAGPAHGAQLLYLPISAMGQIQRLFGNLIVNDHLLLQILPKRGTNLRFQHTLQAGLSHLRRFYHGA